jgi:hypothetical protein
VSGQGPLRAVIAAIDAGASSVDDVVRRTSLDRDLVDLAIRRLIALGRLQVAPSPASCALGSCGSCAQVGASAVAGCSAAGGSRAPVMLTLTRPTQ